MRKNNLIVLGCLLIFFSCQNHREGDVQVVNNKDLPHIPFLASIGEPTGNELKSYDFYLSISHYTAFKNYNIFSLRVKNNQFATFYKTTASNNIKVLSNEFETNEPVSFQTFYKKYSLTELDTVRNWINKLNISQLNNTKGKYTSMTDGEGLDLFIIEGDSMIKVHRLGGNEALEQNYVAFVKQVLARYFSYVKNGSN